MSKFSQSLRPSLRQSALVVKSHKILPHCKQILHNWLEVMFPPAPIDVKLVLVQLRNLEIFLCQCLFAD